MALRFAPLLVLLVLGVSASQVALPSRDASAAPAPAYPDRAFWNAAAAEPASLSQLERMKAFIRQDAEMSYAARCGGLSLPDSAFVPIEINGGGPAELAVFYSHAQCPAMGASGFSGSGGTMIQFWGIAGGDAPPRLLLEHDMLGFTPRHAGLETHQHGGYCGVSGAQGCRVLYRWVDGRLETAAREPGDPARPATMNWTYDGLDNPALPGSQASGLASTSADETPAMQLERMRRAVRRDAQHNYGPECGPVVIPDSAITPLEITGDAFPELAVDLSQAQCPAQGMTRFAGTGGPLIQIWHMARAHDGRTGPVRLLLEQQMRSYRAGAAGLVTVQHDAACPDDRVSAFCRVVYAWDARSRRLERSERRRVAALEP